MLKGAVLLFLIIAVVKIVDWLRPWRNPLLPASQEAALVPQLTDPRGNVLDMCEQRVADCSGKEYIYYYDDGTNAITSATSSHSDFEQGGTPLRTEDRSTLVVVRVDRLGETMSALEYETGINQKLNPDGTPAGPREVVIIENGHRLNFSDGLIKNMTEAAR
jgi:hypothetical protein